MTIQKSVITRMLDALRYAVIGMLTAYVVTRIWAWSPVVALIAAIPVFVVALNITGFATLSLYALTPENIAIDRHLRGMVRPKD